MKCRVKSRRGIATVLTTLIILVASVVLGSGVVLYGTSLFQTSAQSKDIAVSGTSIWVDSTGNSGWAWGAADVRNSGDKLLSVDSIQIHGQQVPFANWYANSSSTLTTSQFQSVLTYTKMINTNTGVLDNGTTYNAAWTMPSCYPNGGPANNKLIIQLQSGQSPVCLSQQSGPVSLEPGAKAIIYFKIPQNMLTSVDAGTSSSISIYAGQVGSPVTVTIASK